MGDLSQVKCFNHRDREAAARCPECRRFYCRECVTEHHARVICAACLRKILDGKAPVADRVVPAALVVQAAGGVVLLWLMFYYVGRLLLRLPSSFHDGTLWK